MRQVALLLVLISVAVSPAFSQTDWPTYGHDPGGQRYSPLKQIDPANVSKLKVAWVYHMRPSNAPAVMTPACTGRSNCKWLGEGVPDVSNSPNAGAIRSQAAEGILPSRRASRFVSSEMTPIIAGGLMYLSSPYRKIVALDPVTGKEVWSYDTPGLGLPCIRGVEYWPGDGNNPPEVLCANRDGKLVALNAKTGKPVESFGTDGVIDMKTPEVMNGSSHNTNLSMTSPPIVYKNLVITGSFVPEIPGQGPAGDVRAWNVVTGKLVWTFHSVPRPGEKGHETWLDDGWKNRTGVNVWGFMTLDAARGIVYMPFGAPSYDRYGGDRKGDNLFGTALVAADANTGKMLWYFQVVHHDIWDYDLECPPVLMEIKHGLKYIPAVAIVSKSSNAFFLNRVTGEPIYPIEERPVPKSDMPGEAASPTQPFPVVTPPLSRQNFTMADIATAATTTPEHEAFCRDWVTKNNMTYGPVFTPVPYKRTIISFPSNEGGIDWGGASFNPALGLMIVNSSDLAEVESLVPTPDRPALPYGPGPITGRFWEDGDIRLPCQQPPWGRLIAVNVNTGRIAWQVPLGITESLPAGKQNTGRPSMGGSIATASGLIFIGATDDEYFRAFDAKNGAELWRVKLGAAANAVPATYQAEDGKQYVVITSTGGTFLDNPITDDSVTAFALPSN